MTIHDFITRKQSHTPITMLTCYDYWSARLLEQTGVDALLVGDSAAMVMHGYPDTTAADTQMMVYHVQAVRRGAPESFIIADMPFLSCRKGIPAAIEQVDTLIKAGANAVKIESLAGQEEVIEAIVLAGVPVMGHLGLTPQAVNQLGGYRVQGRNETAGNAIISDARRLEELGCFSLVLECVPASLAAETAGELDIPVIGIGAGAQVDGQVLVLHDMLGLVGGHTPKFVRSFLSGSELVTKAVSDFIEATREGSFPSKNESYT